MIEVTSARTAAIVRTGLCFTKAVTGEAVRALTDEVLFILKIILKNINEIARR